ncbi:GNVR domain-containing protein [Lichenihabitans sp. Uapishka_5]|uniref:GNVR domain-containing protein n=1 Tax=Lichenihabitans sp. Uapishka_5 TaxID=3037302 RepID=UPI0029E81F08|nr:GNVR domain-containing protein [Lichenihabitans sp. Uapishka_5]MDX7950248.1 GNVR domain-containing protein [Lichenihabitans sp. Uapishka_5]
MLDQKAASTLLDLRPAPRGGRSFAFVDLYRFVKLRRVTILVPICGFLGLAYGYTLIALPTYSARAQIIIDPRIPQFIPGRNEETVMAWDSAQVESEIAVLSSERIAGEVITKLGLERDKDFHAPLSMINRLRLLVGLKPTSAEGERSDRYREALGVIHEGLNVRRTGLSYAIDITFSHPEAFRTSEIANAIAEAYIADQLDNRSQAARLGGEWLQGRMVLLRSQMNAASKAVQVFRASHNYSITRPGPAPEAGSGQGQPAAGDRPEEASLDELDAAASTYRKIYESFLQSYTESVQRQSFPVSDARILNPASQPTSKSAPRGRLVFALAALLGVLTGLGCAILRHNLDRAIRAPWQVADFCAIDELGLLPLVRRRSLRSALARLRMVVARKSTSPWVLSGAIQSRRRADWRWLVRPRGLYFLATPVRPRSHFSDAVLSIKTLMALHQRHMTCRCLGVTAAHRGAGVSTVASNLASLAAAGGTRTLLIDADESRRTLSRHMRLHDHLGLREALDDVGLLDEAIVRSSPGRPDILPASSPGAGSFATGVTKPVDALMEHLSTRYDLVIFDLAPLWPIGEALEFCAALDGVILVAEWGRTQTEALTAMAECLNRVQARTLGFVLNKAHA